MPKISINEFYGGLSDDVRQRSGATTGGAGGAGNTGRIIVIEYF